MTVAELLRGVPGLKNTCPTDVEIASIQYDSRRVEPQTLFFAIQGQKADGHDFIPAALERGAVAIASERPAPPELASRWIQVESIRRALSDAARAFYGRPDERLKLVGITGTNGKTTTAYLLESIFGAADIPCGVFGTIEHRFGGRNVAALNTTPESLDLLSYFDELIRAGGRAAVMEVSSHALAQERVWGFHFAAAVFTNLTQDHLDYHKDFEHYFQAKRRLFEGLGTPPPELAVINVTDPWGARLVRLGSRRTITYGLNSGADVRVEQSTQDADGIRATLLTPQGSLEVGSPLLGRANLMNILAAAATAVGLGIGAREIAKGIAALRVVPGRLERVDAGQPFLVLVDYAHTDDALRNVLAAARGLTKNRLIVVFGCGGDRDRAKRPLMGEAASSFSDLAILTSDNPRSEDPLRIMSDALVGLQKTGKPYWAEVDREEAIRRAFREAREGDVVIVAGKGHETYQILKDRTIPFDDREVARRILREMGYGRDSGLGSRVSGQGSRNSNFSSRGRN
jgi:UDP-N-acetylmuramoyl-L-alanyl-D-glutamate--2,6-diaminopimelate ligase